ncbi:transposase [Acetobacter sacchari]|uniref:transposase n=1 Tax=Acetobacter sacchari TaxID=2661687 RepID=UPI00311CB531
MTLSQTTGFAESLLRVAGLAWSVPDFSTPSRRQKTLTVDIAYRGSNRPLRLLIDGTGIREADGAPERGGLKRRIWRKLHIGTDEGSLEIRTTDITDDDVGDSLILPAFLIQNFEDEEITNVAAVGAYNAGNVMKQS